MRKCNLCGDPAENGLCKEDMENVLKELFSQKGVDPLLFFEAVTHGVRY